MGLREKGEVKKLKWRFQTHGLRSQWYFHMVFSYRIWKSEIIIYLIN